MKIIAFAILAMLVPAVSAVSVTGTAAVSSPTAAILQALGLTVNAQVLSPTAEEQVLDDAEASTGSAKLDLSQADTLLLAKISKNIALSQDSFLFNVEEHAPADKPGVGVDEVAVMDLYKELARRAKVDEKEARQALALAILRGDARAKNARDMQNLSNTAKTPAAPVAVSPSALPTAAPTKGPGI